MSESKGEVEDTPGARGGQGAGRRVGKRRWRYWEAVEGGKEALRLVWRGLRGKASGINLPGPVAAPMAVGRTQIVTGRGRTSKCHNL